MAGSLCVDACSGGGRVVGLTKPRYAGPQSSLTVNISRLVKITNKPSCILISTQSLLQPPEWGTSRWSCGNISPRRPKTQSSRLRMFYFYLPPGPVISASSSPQSSPWSWCRYAGWVGIAQPELCNDDILCIYNLRSEKIPTTMHPGILTYLVAALPRLARLEKYYQPRTYYK